MEASDMELVRAYARDNSEQAFRALVERHVNLVHAVALRQTGHRQVAEDVTQAVFIVLAEKAASLPPKTVLTGWLFRATRFAAANVKRAESRRNHWEQKAAQMEPPNSSDVPGSADSANSEQELVAPLLNDALAELPEQDRAAILLRFFESKSMEEVGRTLGTSESAAKMRLSRAVEKLRLIFRKRGVVVSAAALLGALSAQSAHAAPAGLASSVAALAFLKQTSASTLPIVKGTLILMAQTKSKALIIGALVFLLFGGTVAVVIQHALARKPAASDSAPNIASAVAAEMTAAKSNPGYGAATTTVAGRVLVFRNRPSWNRNPDFEDTLSAMSIQHDVKPSAEMATTDLAPYRFVIIPGAQGGDDFYPDYVAQAARFNSYVANGGTLVLELNGAEGSRLLLPRGVSMAKHYARENSILVPDHPILTPMGGRPIQANYASHGYLENTPQDALVLTVESTDGQPDTSKPTFIEYVHGTGRVLAACQCFHDQDHSHRGPLMETLLFYASQKQWFTPKK